MLAALMGISCYERGVEVQGMLRLGKRRKYRAVFAGKASAINYSSKTTQMLDMAESGGARLRPNRHLSFAAHQQTGGLAQSGYADRSRFVIITSTEVAASISYITIFPSTVSGIVFLANTLTSRAGCSSQMDLCRCCGKL